MAWSQIPVLGLVYVSRQRELLSCVRFPHTHTPGNRFSHFRLRTDKPVRISVDDTSSLSQLFSGSFSNTLMLSSLISLITNYSESSIQSCAVFLASIQCRLLEKKHHASSFQAYMYISSSWKSADSAFSVMVVWCDLRGPQGCGGRVIYIYLSRLFTESSFFFFLIIF